MTVCPRLISASKALSKRFISWKCSPVVGSSKMNRVGSWRSCPMKLASFTRWFSPPERVEELCPNLIYPSPTSSSDFRRLTIVFCLCSPKNSIASLTVIWRTSLIFFPWNLTSRISRLKRSPWHSSHTSSRSAINCISTVITPAPLHSSQRPPSALNEKCCAVNPICFDNCCSAKSWRIAS